MYVLCLRARVAVARRVVAELSRRAAASDSSGAAHPVVNAGHRGGNEGLL